MGDVPEEMLESKDDNLTVKNKFLLREMGRFEDYTIQYRKRSLAF